MISITASEPLELSFLGSLPDRRLSRGTGSQRGTIIKASQGVFTIKVFITRNLVPTLTSGTSVARSQKKWTCLMNTMMKGNNENDDDDNGSDNDCDVNDDDVSVYAVSNPLVKQKGDQCRLMVSQVQLLIII